MELRRIAHASQSAVALLNRAEAEAVAIEPLRAVEVPRGKLRDGMGRGQWSGRRLGLESPGKARPGRLRSAALRVTDRRRLGHRMFRRRAQRLAQEGVGRGSHPVHRVGRAQLANQTSASHSVVARIASTNRWRSESTIRPPLGLPPFAVDPGNAVPA